MSSSKNEYDDNKNKDTIKLISQNMNLDNDSYDNNNHVYEENNQNRRDGNIDINASIYNEKYKKKRNVDINDDKNEGINSIETKFENSTLFPKKNEYGSNNRIETKFENSNLFPKKNEIDNIVENINKNIKKFQIIPLHIQKGEEKKNLLVKTNMTLKEVLFINFKVSDYQDINFYIDSKNVSMDETIENQKIKPFSIIKDYPE